VLPHDDPGLPAEDSLAFPDAETGGLRGTADGVPDDRAVTVAVPRLPRLSNATDLEPLARTPGVRVAFVPLSGGERGESEAVTSRGGREGTPAVGRGPSLVDADAVVVPGTKNTADDLLAARRCGFLDRLRAFDGPVVGLCGGYQLLGERLLAADREGTGETATIPGAGLLSVETRFDPEKRVAPVTWTLDGVGPLAGLSERVEGYEIHAGRTTATGPVARPFPAEGVAAGAADAAEGRVVGTYLHGLFENRSVRRTFLAAVRDHAGVPRPETDAAASASGGAADPFDRAAALVAPLPLDALGVGVETPGE
jgi:adenosylcobyric acid synthase